MAFIVFGNEKQSKFDLSMKVLKANDVRTLKEAHAILADAKLQRETIVKAALIAFTEEQQRGFKEGYEKAQQEQSIHMIDIVTKTVEYFGQVEQKMINIVLDSVHKILGEINNEEKVINLVKNALSVARSRSEINIKINPEISEKIKNELISIKQNFPSFANIEIIADPSVPTDACVIESELGKVESSVSGQLEALRSSFEKIFGKDDGYGSFSRVSNVS